MLGCKTVTMPHDTMIWQKRSKDASDGGHGASPGGIYRPVWIHVGNEIGYRGVKITTISVSPAVVWVDAPTNAKVEIRGRLSFRKLCDELWPGTGSRKSHG